MNILLADFHKYAGYSGGIEKVLSQMAAALHARGHAVTAVFADEKDGRPFFPLPDGVKVYNLYRVSGCAAVRPGTFGKILREAVRPFSRAAARNQNYRLLAKAAPALRAVLERETPDVIVSFREPTGRLLLEGVKTDIPVISMLHNDPDEIFDGAPEAEKKALAKSACIQVLLPPFTDSAKKYLDYGRFTAIPNTVPAPERFADPGQPRKVHTIACVGRLTGRTKRQHLLIEAFAPLAAEFPDWQVELWGAQYDKPYVTSLRALIKKYGLEKRVRLCGTTKDMQSVWDRTDIFAFPSHHEGFPLALTEAMSCGIPAVGYRSCAAVSQLIEDPRTGLLCDEGTEPLTKALRVLMESGGRRRDMGLAARLAMQAYRPDAVWDRWEALMKEVVEEAKGQQKKR